MKYIGTFVLIITLLFVLLPIPLGPGYAGWYNGITRTYWCVNDYTCAHERGHALDQSLGWPSQSREFTRMLQTYLVVHLGQNDQDKIANRILDFPGLLRPAPHWFYNTPMELYATLYAGVWGKIDQLPESFRKFYLAGWDK